MSLMTRLSVNPKGIQIMIRATLITCLLLFVSTATQAQPVGANTYTLEKGDVITEVNGSKIV